MKLSFARSARRQAFTLVEIMVATTIAGLAVVGTTRFFIMAPNTYSYETGKLLVNRDIRTFTAEMTENATYANYLRIYPSYSNLTRTVSTLVNALDPDLGYTTAITGNSVNDGVSGDCLVLVYKDAANDRKIARLIIYFRSPDNPNDANSTGPVRRIDLAITPSSLLPVDQLIPTISNPAIYPEVVPISRGLSNGKLFYNFYDRSIILKGEIIHAGSKIRRATNTYNFTVSPRG